MYDKIYDTKKLLNIQLENQEIDKESAKFISFYWDSIRSDYLSKVTKRSIWVPHIGEFTVKNKPLRVMIIRKLKVLRKLRRNGKNKESVENELKQLLIIRNEIATERYNFVQHYKLCARQSKILPIQNEDEEIAL